MKFPRHADLWFPSYLRDRAERLLSRSRPRRLWVALTDHFEPMGGDVSPATGHARIAAWQQRWPHIAAAAPRDAAGNPPCFTFFYPQEEYNRHILDAVAGLCRDGSADVEVHIHHDHDTAAAFTARIRDFTERLRNDHGLLHQHRGQKVFGFIHGNWALDNALGGRHCGLTGELQLLRELGCYADFTMPALPSPAQSRIVNRIYWTAGASPRGFDRGTPAKVAGGAPDGLLMITGPTGLRFRERLIPRLETGELACYDPPTPYRVRRWLALAPRIGDDVFLKLYGHSAREDNAAALLGSTPGSGALAPMFRWIHEEAARQNLALRWVSAFEMFRAVDALVNPQ